MAYPHLHMAVNGDVPDSFCQELSCTQQTGAALGDDTHQNIATALHLILEIL
jgi:hypothetical protein